MWFILKTQFLWWLIDRYKWRRQCARLNIQCKELKRANGDLQERLFISNRDRLESDGRLKQAQEMWVHEGSQWRDQIERIMIWMARVSTGFGPGDSIPTQETVTSDPISPGKVHPFDLARAILNKAATHGRNPQST